MIPRLFWRDGGAAALWPCNQQSVFVLLSISLLQRADACIGCGKCAESCPAHTIRIQDRKAVIAYQNCIHCFCCHEMCPRQAVDIRRRGIFDL